MEFELSNEHLLLSNQTSLANCWNGENDMRGAGIGSDTNVPSITPLNLSLVQNQSCDERIMQPSPFESSLPTCQTVPFNNNNNNNHTSSTKIAIQATTTRILVAMTEITRLFFPAVISICYALIRNHKTAVDSLRRRLIPALVAFLANSLSRSLSSVQAFRPKRKNGSIILEPSTPEVIISQPNFSNGLEKSVSCDVIVEPSSGSEHRADVIFIHGLHGSLNKTWRQGTWNVKKVSSGVTYERRESTTESMLDSDDDEDDDNITQANSRKRSFTQPMNCPECCPTKKASMEEGLTLNDVGHCCVKTEEKNNSCGEGVSKCWPQDWLPNDCPGVRVIALNYTTDPYLWRPVWVKQRKRTSLEQRSREMIKLLLEKNVGERPIIWVAHSKGGLFVKQLIINAWENQQFDDFEDYESIRPNLNNLLEGFYKQSKGLMFYSVPHLGSPLAEMNLPLLRQSIELQEIQKDSPLLVELHRKFLELCDSKHFNPEIFSFIETSLTLMSIVYLKIVPFESADPGIGTICGVPIDHRDICKPTSRKCVLYQELAELINRVV